MTSRDRVLSGQINICPRVKGNASFKLSNSSTGEDFGPFRLDGASQDAFIYASEDDIFSESELDSVIAGGIDQNSPQFNQEIVFFQDSSDPDVMQFVSSFTGLGTITAELSDSDGLVTRATILLTADAELSDFIDRVTQRIGNIDFDPLPPAEDSDDGTLDFDDEYEEGSSSSSSSSSTVDSPAMAMSAPRAFSSRRSPAPISPGVMAAGATTSGTTTNLVTKIVKWVALPGTLPLGYLKGFIDGLWDGVKTDASSIGELINLVTGDWKGDYHRAKSIWDSVKLLRDLTPTQWRDTLQRMMNNFLSDSEKRIPWTFDPGSIPDQAVLVVYVTGYSYGFVVEQIIALELIAGAISKVGEAVKVILRAAKVGELVISVTNAIARFINAATYFLSQFVESVPALRELYQAISRLANLTVAGGRAVGELYETSLFVAQVGYASMAARIRKTWKIWVEVTRTYAFYANATIFQGARVILALGVEMTPDAFLGFLEYFPGTINAEGLNTFRYILEYCSDGAGVVNKAKLNEFLELFSSTSSGYKLSRDAINPTTWVTPGGWQYANLAAPGGEGNRLIHLLHHTVEDAARLAANRPHGIFNAMSPKDLLRLVDRVRTEWASLVARGKVVPVPHQPNPTWLIDMDEIVGTCNNVPGTNLITPSKLQTSTTKFRVAGRGGPPPVKFVTSFPVH